MEEDLDEFHKNESFKYGMVHFVLSHSYFMFFIAVILGAIFHSAFNVYLFSATFFPYVGFAMIILGSLLIYWSQATSARVQKQTGLNRTEKDFERGPYKYSRNPTHIGLTIMTLGLAIILNSFFTFVFLLIASIITKLIFLREEEKLLEKKYGQVYLDYKKKVGSWL